MDTSDVVDTFRKLHPATKQAIVWGAGGLAAHKLNTMAEKKRDQNVHQFKSDAEKKRESKIEKIHSRHNFAKGVAATLTGAASGALGTVV